MMKTIAKKAVMWGLNYMYNYIDKNNNGKLEKKEFQQFAKELYDFYNKIKAKAKKINK